MNLNIDEIKDLEQRIFPELKIVKENIINVNHSLGQNPWVVFAPSFYAKHPAILTEDLIINLLNDKKMLSVGSGPAYLEQFLVKAYNIPIQNITLSDLNNQNVPTGFNFVEIDMHQKWPNIPKVDYVIFPESIFFGITSAERKELDYNAKISMFQHLIQESLMRLKYDGEVRMKGALPSSKAVQITMNKLNINSEDYKYVCGNTLIERSLCVKNKNNL